MNSKELTQMSAVAAVEQLKKRALSPTDLVNASIARIEEVDPHLNAMVTRSFEQALDRARDVENHTPDESTDPGWLAGLPIAVKDVTPVRGMRTTFGSTLYADYIPDRSDVLVETLERFGAIVMGKSNTPEFAAGASTFNDVFGITRNPWNTSKSVSGSSGGSAAALASGQVWLATGSDLGGSLRTPASFNSVLGLRPGPGRVPHGPVKYQFSMLMPDGIMARDAEDLALGMDTVARCVPEDPFSMSAPAISFLDQVRAARPPARIAWSQDLGITPVDPEVRDVTATVVPHFESMGTRVAHTQPDFSDAKETFQTLRAALFATEHADHLRDYRDQLKPEVVWNIEKGLALTADEIGKAQIAQAALYQRMVSFFKDHDFLICPTAIVPPFDAEVRFIDEVDGVKFDNYIEWIAITSAISLTGCPAVSVPAGFTKDGLPIGVQIIGPPRGEAAVLGAARLLDQATGISSRLPIDPVTR